MDYGLKLLLWLHMVALAVGGMASFGIPLIGARAAAAKPEVKPALIGLARRFSTFGRGALVVLIVTGLLLVWLSPGGLSVMPGLFWVKMALVVLLTVLMILGGLNAARLVKGDAAAIARAPKLSMASVTVFLLILLSAVFTFN